MKIFKRLIHATASVAFAAAIATAATPAASAQPLPPLPALPPIPAPLFPAPPLPGSDITFPAPITAPAVPGSSALPGFGSKQLVTFGDSFTANPNLVGLRPTVPSGFPIHCRQDLQNWPRTAAAKMGKSLGDYSCNGTGGTPYLMLKTFLETSIAKGELGPGTEKVVMMYGGLDPFGWADAAGELGRLNPQFTLYKAEIQDFTRRIHEVAPGAEIVLAGYPTLGDGDNLCLVNVVPNATFPLTIPGGTAVEDSLRNAQRAAADAAGIRFLDVRGPSTGHGTCALEHDRWVSGYVDTTAPTNMAMHPTIVGEQAVGNIIADQL